MSQKATRNHFCLLQEGRTRILIDPNFLSWLRELGFQGVGEIIEKTEIDPDRGGRHGLRVFCPNRSSDGRFLVRHYGRGGLLRRLLGDSFLFGSRPFREILITHEVRKRGIPTARVVAALHHRIWGPLYRGDLVTVEIPDTRDLVSVFSSCGSRPSREANILKQEIAREAGRTIRFMHDHGIYHGDLNLKNLLVQISSSDGPKVYIVDFDRSKISGSLSTGKKMKNIFRLDRSAEKLKTQGIPITYTDKIRFFHAYAQGDNVLIQSLRRYVRTYRLRTWHYRLGWSADRLLNPSSRQ